MNVAIDVVHRSMLAASTGRDWRAMVDFELLPLSEQCGAVHEAMASLSSSSGCLESIMRW